MKWSCITLSILVSSLMVCGCSTETGAPNNDVVTSSGNKVATVKPDQKSHNGSIVSMKRLTDGYTDSDIYEVFYESAGEKVQAYIELPVKHGNYPLMVICHGGYILPYSSTSHYNFGWTYDNITEHTGKAIYIYPEYRGYLNSDGTIPGFNGVVTDIQNAITAAMALKGYSINGVYLFGVSVGAGAVLQVASERNDVKAVVANSPFVGLDVTDVWYEELGKPNVANWKYIYTNSRKLYGTNYSSPSYTTDSPMDHTNTIQCPVLLLQGTQDTEIIPQTVQRFAQKMKQEHKTVNLELVKGGHALQDTPSMYTNDVVDPTNSWFMKYGFPENLL